MKIFKDFIRESEEDPKQDDFSELENIHKADLPEPELKGYYIYCVVGKFRENGNSSMYGMSACSVQTSRIGAIIDYLQERLGLNRPLSGEEILEIYKDPKKGTKVVIDKNSLNFKLPQMVCGDFRVVENLTPKSDIKDPKSVGMIDGEPYHCIWALESLFSNARAKVGGLTFMTDNPMKSDMDDLCNYFISNPTEIYILEDMPEIKDDVFKRLEDAGIDDIVAIVEFGKALKKGLI